MSKTVEKSRLGSRKTKMLKLKFNDYRMNILYPLSLSNEESPSVSDLDNRVEDFLFEE